MFTFPQVRLEYTIYKNKHIRYVELSTQIVSPGQFSHLNGSGFI